MAPVGDLGLDRGSADAAWLRVRAAAVSAGATTDAALTWSTRTDALVAVVVLPGMVGGVARAARLVGARERDYRRWLSTARAWLLTDGARALRAAARPGPHSDLSPGEIPTVPREDVARGVLCGVVRAASSGRLS